MVFASMDLARCIEAVECGLVEEYAAAVARRAGGGAVFVADAALAGCDLAVVTTLPGSKSQQNVQRHGFALLYTRAILRRGP